MNESFSVGATLSLKTLYTNVALDKYHRVSKFSQSKDRRTSADLISWLALLIAGTGISHIIS